MKKLKNPKNPQRLKKNIPKNIPKNSQRFKKCSQKFPKIKKIISNSSNI
jgi:hypothetical protein